MNKLTMAMCTLQSLPSSVSGNDDNDALEDDYCDADDDDSDDHKITIMIFYDQYDADDEQYTRFLFWSCFHPCSMFQKQQP